MYHLWAARYLIMIQNNKDRLQVMTSLQRIIRHSSELRPSLACMHVGISKGAGGFEGVVVSAI